MPNIAIFASGAGSNAREIIHYFLNHPGIFVKLVACNKPGAGVIDVAAGANLPVLIIEKERFFRGDAFVPALREHKIDFIVLAGFLWKIPTLLIDAFQHKIVNIHPALLPKYGGKGMYGAKVHEAVLQHGEKESGITIHYVDEQYDQGQLICQATCIVESGETPESLASKVHKLEHQHYPRVIRELLETNA